MRKITLGQLLQYYGTEDEPTDQIQIVTEKQNWENADEVYANSGLLDPFSGWVVSEMRCEESRSRKPIIRAMIVPSESAPVRANE